MIWQPTINLDVQSQYVCSDAAGGPAVVRREGGAVSTVVDVNKAYDYLGETYEFYHSRFGRDSIDGAGMPMRATVRACDYRYSCPYDNAFWDGEQMVFGQGYAAADDVVGHELTHGVTQHTSRLFYISEAGAINESLSDIMGQFIDLANGTDDDAAGSSARTFPAARSGA